MAEKLTDQFSSLALASTPEPKQGKEVPVTPENIVGDSTEETDSSSDDDVIIHHVDTQGDLLVGPYSDIEKEIYTLYYNELRVIRKSLGDMGMNYFHLRSLFDYVTHSTVTQSLNLATLQMAQVEAEQKAHSIVRDFYNRQTKIDDGLTALRIKAHCEEMAFHLRQGGFRNQLLHAVTMDEKGIDLFVDNLQQWFPSENDTNPFELRQRPYRATHVVFCEGSRTVSVTGLGFSSGGAIQELEQRKKDQTKDK